MPTLDRALALPQVDTATFGVRQHLHLDVPRTDNKLFHEDGIVAECRTRFAAGLVQRGSELYLFLHDTHALAATAGGGLEQDGIADFPRVRGGFLHVARKRRCAGHDRHVGFLHQLARLQLVAHRPHGRRRRSDERQTGVDDRLCEVRVLGEEAVARMDRVGTAFLRRVDDVVDDEVRLGRRRRPDRVGLVGEADVQRLAIRVGVDRDRADTHLAAGAMDPDGDLAAVGDQHLAKRWRGRGRCPRPSDAPRGHSGMFPCLRGGLLSRLLRNRRNAAISLARVRAGSITSST